MSVFRVYSSGPAIAWRQGALHVPAAGTAAPRLKWELRTRAYVRPWAAGPEAAASGSFTSAGALEAQAATVAGTATHLTLHTATGVIAAQAATVAGEAAHYTLHTATGALEARSASVSGSAVDESTYVAPVNRGGGKSKRKLRYQVEIDGVVHDVASPEEAEAVLADMAQKAQETAKVAIERASKAKRRPVRKVVSDARKALHVPEIAVPADFRDLANQILGQVRAEYQSALSAIEIAAHMARREREIEEDDEEVLMLL